MKVYIATFGSGLGHVSRMAMVADELRRRGAKVRFSSSAEGTCFLRGRGYAVNDIPDIDVGWDTRGGFSLYITARSFIKMIFNLVRQLIVELKNIKSYGADVVISDSLLSTILAARLLGRPSFVVTNQLRLLFPPHSSRIKAFAENAFAEIFGRMWRVTKAIFVPDLPPPYTISAKNLWSIHSVADKIKYVGFITPALPAKVIELTKEDLGLEPDKPLIYAQVSGPKKTRGSLLRTLINSASGQEEEKWNFVISAGQPGGRSEPVKVRNGLVYEWCPLRDEIFLISDILLVRGGHTTIGQIISYGKPVICVPIKKHSEQISNSQRVAELGMGVWLEDEEAENGKLGACISEIVSKSSFRQKAREMSHIVSMLRGQDEIAKIVMETIREKRETLQTEVLLARR